MYITSLDNVKKVIPNMEGAKGVYKQVPLSKEHGAPTFSFRVFTIEPGGHTPFHNHPFEHMNYVIEGNGTIVTADHEINLEKGNLSLFCPVKPINTKTHQQVNHWL